MTDKAIQIEIMKSEYVKGFNIRIGDIQGSTELSNFSKEDILNEISNEIDGLAGEKSK